MIYNFTFFYNLPLTVHDCAQAIRKKNVQGDDDPFSQQKYVCFGRPL